MLVKKYEISRVIDKLKSIVQKNDRFPALGGILVKDGYLIASNTEITLKVKLEASVGNYFIIPLKALDLIKNLPDGDVEICSTEKNEVIIKTGSIKNKYQSMDPEEFAFDVKEDEENPGVTLDGKKIMEAMGHVVFAASDNMANIQMTGVYFDGRETEMKLVALDGHVIAIDSIPTSDAADLKLIVPKNTVKKLVSLGMIDDVTVTYTKGSAVFKSEEYAVFTRLINGKYFTYEKMFGYGETKTIVSRTDLVGAMTRAKMCTEEKQPAVFDINGKELNVRIADSRADYKEMVELQVPVEKPMKIGFDSKLVLETIKAFGSENIVLNFTNSVTPMIMEAEDSDMKAAVLPVKIRG